MDKRTRKTRGFTPKQLAAAHKARERAAAGTPKEVSGALLADGSGFQPVTLCTVLLLEQIGSPFITDTGIRTPKMLDITRALFVLTHPIEHVDKLAAKGLQAFDVEVKRFAATVPLGSIAGLGDKIDAHIAKAMSTAIPHGEEPSGPLAGRPAQEPGSAGN